MHPTIDRIVWRLSYIGLKKMDAVIAVSNFSRQILIRRLHLDPRRVFTVHSGINTSTFRPIPGARQELIARYRLPAAEELRYLTYVGTEIPRKNMRTILKTLSRLPPNVMLLKVGSPGNWRARQATYDEIRRLGLGGRVLFYEDVPDDDLPLFYSAADAYIACSFLEGFCMPILEAMACGTPVVCSNVAALPEVAGDAAILIPPTDDRRFAEAVASILSDSRLRKRMASKGLERTRTFSWQKTAEGVMAVYERVAQQHRESG
jgi:glycosyltransferase involved in cell wall biosynthesis